MAFLTFWKEIQNANIRQSYRSASRRHWFPRWHPRRSRITKTAHQIRLLSERWTPRWSNILAMLNMHRKAGIPATPETVNLVKRCVQFTAKSIWISLVTAAVVSNPNSLKRREAAQRFWRPDYLVVCARHDNPWYSGALWGILWRRSLANLYLSSYQWSDGWSKAMAITPTGRALSCRLPGLFGGTQPWFRRGTEQIGLLGARYQHWWWKGAVRLVDGTNRRR